MSESNSQEETVHLLKRARELGGASGWFLASVLLEGLHTLNGRIEHFQEANQRFDKKIDEIQMGLDPLGAKIDIMRRAQQRRFRWQNIIFISAGVLLFASGILATRILMERFGDENNRLTTQVDMLATKVASLEERPPVLIPVSPVATTPATAPLTAVHVTQAIIATATTKPSLETSTVTETPLGVTPTRIPPPKTPPLTVTPPSQATPSSFIDRILPDRTVNLYSGPSKEDYGIWAVFDRKKLLSVKILGGKASLDQVEVQLIVHSNDLQDKKIQRDARLFWPNSATQVGMVPRIFEVGLPAEDVQDIEGGLLKVIVSGWMAAEDFAPQ